jgi:hypothetical protein
MILLYVHTILAFFNAFSYGFEVIEYEVDFKYESK